MDPKYEYFIYIWLKTEYRTVHLSPILNGYYELMFGGHSGISMSWFASTIPLCSIKA